MTLRDQAALEDIVSYCERIREYLCRGGNTEEAFSQDLMVQDACCMCVIQIGELVNLLTEETKAGLSQIPWRLVKETRNFYVHNYGEISKVLVWNTLQESIPALEESCRAALGL